VIALLTGATHEGFWSSLQGPGGNPTEIQSLVFQAEIVSPVSGFSWNRTFMVSCIARGLVESPTATS
jgi:hypothetical protein